MAALCELMSRQYFGDLQLRHDHRPGIACVDGVRLDAHHRVRGRNLNRVWRVENCQHPCGEMLRWTVNVISDDNVTWQRNLREGRTERSRKFCSQEAAKGVSAKCL